MEEDVTRVAEKPCPHCGEKNVYNPSEPRQEFLCHLCKEWKCWCQGHSSGFECCDCSVLVEDAEKGLMKVVIDGEFWIDGSMESFLRDLKVDDPEVQATIDALLGSDDPQLEIEESGDGHITLSIGLIGLSVYPEDLYKALKPFLSS